METHLKLRKHFDHKFNSKVKLQYAEKKESTADLYKSRFKALNQSNVLAQKMINFYNSQIF